jgi:hypothetical protein
MTFGVLWLKGDQKFDPSGFHALIQVLPLLVTNIVATSLMAYKMWCVHIHPGQRLRRTFVCCVDQPRRQYRQQIKVQLDFPKNKKTKVERILVILTESGMIYCLIWVYCLPSLIWFIHILTYSRSPDPLPVHDPHETGRGHDRL